MLKKGEVKYIAAVFCLTTGEFLFRPPLQIRDTAYVVTDHHGNCCEIRVKDGFKLAFKKPQVPTNLLLPPSPVDCAHVHLEQDGEAHSSRGSPENEVQEAVRNHRQRRCPGPKLTVMVEIV